MRALKAAGEATRLRILALLAEAELTVSDLTDILRQSQPRISRHLKLLAEAGLVERFREGVLGVLPAGRAAAAAPTLARDLRRAARSRPTPTVARDRERLAAVRHATRRGGAGLFRPPCRRVGPHPQAPCRRRGGRGRDPRRARRRAVPLAARSRHRHRPHARTVRAADRARPRPRSVARHAGAGAGAARPRGPAPLQRAPGRHLRPRAAARHLRRRHHPSGAALPRRRRARDPRGGARAAARRPAAGRRFRAARSRIPARASTPTAGSALRPRP